MCRKLETEEEKVLPFYASSLTQEEQEDVQAAEAEKPTERLAQVSPVEQTTSPCAKITALHTVGSLTKKGIRPSHK